MALVGYKSHTLKVHAPALVYVEICHVTDDLQAEVDVPKIN